MMLYLTLFLEFFKIGLFAIGGGLATIPFLQNLIDKYAWMSQAELINMIAISESTPGPMGINMATYVGFETAGVLGSLSATFGLVFPSVIIITIIAHYFMKFAEEPIVEAAFTGLRPAVVGLIAAAGLEVAKVTLINMDLIKNYSSMMDIFNFKSIILAGILLFLTNKYKKHPIFYLVISAIIGIVFKFN